MTADDFHLEGDEWHGPSFDTSHGKFTVRLFSEGDLDHPDPELITIADAACEYAKAETDIIAKILFAYFTEIVGSLGKDAVEESFGPVDRVSLSNVIERHGRCDIHVVKDEFDTFCQFIFAAPYDSEHGLQMTFADGAVTEVGDFQVTVENSEVSLS